MSALPDHFFIPSSGELLDMRKPDFVRYSAPVRERYRGLFGASSSIDIRACLRNGPYSWGSYEHFFVTSDGACLCFDCTRENFWHIARSVETQCNDGWLISGLACSSDCDEPNWCDHCNKFISGYEDESEYLERINKEEESA